MVFAVRVVLVLFAVFVLGRAVMEGRLGTALVWMCGAFAAIYILQQAVARSGAKLTEGEREALEVAGDVLEVI